MTCRTGCGACCVAISISAPIPGMPRGKPAGVPCLHLSPIDRSCLIYHHPDRPRVCASLTPSPDICGRDTDEAMKLLTELERYTAPPRPT